jgi:hypothetical protein
VNEAFARYDDIQQAHEEHDVPLEGPNLEERIDIVIPKNLNFFDVLMERFISKLQHPYLKDFPRLRC